MTKKVALLLLIAQMAANAQMFEPLPNNTHHGIIKNAIVHKEQLLFSGEFIFRQGSDLFSVGLVGFDGSKFSSRMPIYTISTLCEYKGDLLISNNIGNSYTTSVLRLSDTTLHNLGIAWRTNVKQFVVLDDKFYAIGSIEKNDEKYLMAEYDGRNWNYIGKLKDGQSNSAIVWKNKLYVAGNFSMAEQLLSPNRGVLVYENGNLRLVGTDYMEEIEYPQLAVRGNAIILGGTTKSSKKAILQEWNGSQWKEKSHPEFFASEVIRTFNSSKGHVCYFSIAEEPGSTLKISGQLFIEDAQENLIPFGDSLHLTMPSNNRNGRIRQVVNGITIYKDEPYIYGSFNSQGNYTKKNLTLIGRITEPLPELPEAKIVKPKTLLSVYPNPTKQWLNIYGIEEWYDLEIEIFQPHGRLVMREKITEPALDVLSLESGHYTMRFYYNGTFYNFPFIKIKE